MGSDKHKKSHKRKHSDDSEADASESSGEAIVVGISLLVVYPYFVQTAAVADASQQHKKSRKQKKDKAKKVRQLCIEGT
jgi:hypothetical protein